MIFSIGCSTSEVAATDPDTTNSNTFNQNDLPESERKMIYVKIFNSFISNYTVINCLYTWLILV